MTTEQTVYGSQTSLREANRTHIVDVVKRFGTLTQVELVDATGLSAGTISVIVKDLVAEGVIETKPTVRNGRRATQVALARRLGLVAGVRFARRHMQVALANLSGEIITEQRLPLAKDHRADAGIDTAAGFISDLLDSIGASYTELLGVGVGMCAPIDSSTGATCSPDIMRGWNGVQIGPSLEARVGAPVFVDNDANLGALAEARFGAGRGESHSIYLAISYGLGSGIVVDGQVFRGFSGTAGEIGHVSVDEDGPMCYCGNRGCLEVTASGTAILQAVRESKGDLSLRDLIAECLDGDASCQHAISDAGRHIGRVLAAVCNLVDPQRIIIGGELAEAGDTLFGPLRLATARFTLPGTAPTIEIVPAQLTNRSELVGAVAYALDQVNITSGLWEQP